MTMPAHMPTFSSADVLKQLDVLSRQPFRDITARLLSNSPTDQQLKAFAEKSPDRWAQAVAIFARLGGFHDKLEIEGALKLTKDMSDSEVLIAIEELERKLQASGMISQPIEQPAQKEEADEASIESVGPLLLTDQRSPA